MKSSHLFLMAQNFISEGHWEASERVALAAVAEHKLDVTRAWQYVEKAREWMGESWMDKDPFDVLEVARKYALEDEQ